MMRPGWAKAVEHGAEQALRVMAGIGEAGARTVAGSCPGLARHGEEIDLGGGGAGRRQAPSRLGLGGERRHDPGFQGVAPLARWPSASITAAISAWRGARPPT